jgi:hypothetical protein
MPLASEKMDVYGAFLLILLLFVLVHKKYRSKLKWRFLHDAISRKTNKQLWLASPPETSG